MRSHRQPGGQDQDISVDVLRHLALSLPQQWARYRKRLKRCRERFSEKRVHNTRVEIRRLLALVDVIGVFLAEERLKAVRRTLKEHLDAFDQLRDTQVQLVYVEPLAASYPAAREFRDWLMKREERFTRETHRAVKQLKTKRLDRRVAAIVDDLGDLRSRQSAAESMKHALHAVRLSFARVTRCRRRISAADTATIHRTRVAFKRFRYALDALAPLFPELGDEHRCAMHRYQTLMGDIQDVEVLLGHLDKWIRNQKPDIRLVRPLQRELLRRRRRLIEVYLRNAGDVDGLWPLAHQAQSVRAETVTRLPEGREIEGTCSA